MADDGHCFSRFDSERSIAENPVGNEVRCGMARNILFRRLAIGEPDVVELDAAGALRAFRGCGGDNFHGSIEQLEDAFAGGHGRLQNVVLLAEVHDWAKKTLRVLHERDQHAQRSGGRNQVNRDQRVRIEFDAYGFGNGAANNLIAPPPDHRRNGDRR